MTVKELIDILSCYNEDTEVFIMESNNPHPMLTGLLDVHDVDDSDVEDIDEHRGSIVCLEEGYTEGYIERDWIRG